MDDIPHDNRFIHRLEGLRIQTSKRNEPCHYKGNKATALYSSLSTVYSTSVPVIFGIIDGPGYSRSSYIGLLGSWVNRTP